eukprot:m.217693 g.217693  ORF g.217693 m.217693 type:complete len:127 (+) comp15563_c0_seq2:725-1105(+)
MSNSGLASSAAVCTTFGIVVQTTLCGHESELRSKSLATRARKRGLNTSPIAELTKPTIEEVRSLECIESPKGLRPTSSIATARTALARSVLHPIASEWSVTQDTCLVDPVLCSGALLFVRESLYPR